jgi:hypothetical protein
MPKDKRTLDRQLAVIADFFSGDLSQADILTKHRVSEQTYRAWQFDTDFTEEIERRIAAAHRESAALIARFSTVAATRLIELTQSPKEEIARRACLDIMALGRPGPPRPPRVSPGAHSEGSAISPEAASKMLAALAEATGGEVPSSE